MNNYKKGHNLEITIGSPKSRVGSWKSEVGSRKSQVSSPKSFSATAMSRYKMSVSPRDCPLSSFHQPRDI